MQLLIYIMIPRWDLPSDLKPLSSPRLSPSISGLTHIYSKSMHCMEKLLPQEMLTFPKLSRISRSTLRLLSLKKAPAHLSGLSRVLDPSTCEERQSTVRNSPATGKQGRGQSRGQAFTTGCSVAAHRCWLTARRVLKDEQCRHWSTRKSTRPGLQRKVPDSRNKFLLSFAELTGHEQFIRADTVFQGPHLLGQS